MQFPDTRPGVRLEHERIAERASRQRRIERGEPCAQTVLDSYAQRLRILRYRRMTPEQRKELHG